MKKCLAIINRMSGRSAKVDKEKLLAKFGAAYDVTLREISSSSDDWSPEGFDLVVACGGDGTFNRALNLCAETGTDLIYFGFGTFNECAKAKGCKKGEREFIRLYEYASACGRYFGYVAAAGSFTPLGYTVSADAKKKMGILAYLLRVVKEYRVCNIPAEITADGRTYDDNYTLIMAIDSARCFGFRFNRLYAPDDGKVHLLLIKSPGRDDLLGRARIFFPLFRSFFMGFGREKESRNIVFRAVKDLSVSLRTPVVFDVDGDAADLGDHIDIHVIKPKHAVYIGDFETLSL